MTVEAIKDAIQQLPGEQRTSLAAWLNEMVYDDWDKQMAKDFVSGGRGMKWLEEAEREAAEGTATFLDEGLARRLRNRE